MRRLDLIAVAVPAGLATGLAAWLLAGGLSVRAESLDTVHAQLARLRPANAAIRPLDSGAGSLLTAPLFALTTGPGAVREPAIRLDGLSVTRRRRAALIAIDEAAAEWLAVGETRGGVTLQAINGSTVTVETPLGVKTLNLGDQSAASSPAPAANVAQTLQDQPPPGVRGPPEPASAPQPR